MQNETKPKHIYEVVCHDYSSDSGRITLGCGHFYTQEDAKKAIMDNVVGLKGQEFKQDKDSNTLTIMYKDYMFCIFETVFNKWTLALD